MPSAGGDDDRMPGKQPNHSGAGFQDALRAHLFQRQKTIKDSVDQ